MTTDKTKKLNDLCIAAHILGMEREELYKKVMSTEMFKCELAEVVDSVIDNYYLHDFPLDGRDS